MSVLTQVKQLGLPLDQMVVIGSGLLDAWGLRASSDVDIVVSTAVFDKLAQDERFTVGVKHGERFVSDDVYEIWETWGKGEEASFESLWREGITIEGVRFVSAHYLMKMKRLRGWEKDLRDITLIEEKLANER